MQETNEEKPNGSRVQVADQRMGITDHPPIYAVARSLSASGQTWHMRMLLTELSAYFLAAITNSVALLLPPGFRPYSIGLTILLLMVAVGSPIIRRQRRFDQQWFEARAVTESVKTATWRYMMKAPPLDQDATADEEFTHMLAQLRKADGVPTRKHALPPGQTITNLMREVRSWEWDRRRAMYGRERLTGQIDWYGRKAKYNAQRAKMFFIATNAARLLAIGSVVLRIARPEWNILPVFIALAASALAWTQAKRFDELEKSYLVARRELSAIKRLANNSPAEERFLSCVVDGENAISREHTMWVARRTLLPEEDARTGEGAVT